MAVLFCLLIFYLGRREVRKAESYAENERSYMESLMKCISSLNSTLETLSSFPYDQITASNGAGYSARLNKDALRLRREITLARCRGETGSKGEVYDTMQEKSQLISSIASALEKDFGADMPEREILLREDVRALNSAVAETNRILEKFLNSELAHFGIWQRQSLYFYQRLQFFLVVFFVLTTVFSISASMLFGYILRHSLKDISHGTGEISAGNLKYRFKDIQNDEVGSVMYDFNSMARRLEKQTEALQNANSELMEKATLLADANRHKDRFLANMSHELRTPLNAIIGFSDLIISRMKHDEKISSHAGRILVAAEHLLELISGLLEIAKADAGVLKPVFKEFNLSASLNSAVSMLSPLAENRNLHLEKIIPDDYMIESDERFIRQISINLISNAIKFTHKGAVTVLLESAQDSYAIVVRDTGIGISAEDQKHIFRDFHRVESGLTSNYEGVGLGLTLSKKLVEFLGGRITVSSESDKGSVFTVKLPKLKKCNTAVDMNKK